MISSQEWEELSDHNPALAEFFEHRGSRMQPVKHLLSFVANAEANMLSVHMDRDGIAYWIERLTHLRDLIDSGECEHCHLFTADSIGSELSSTKLEGKVEEAVIVQHVKLYAWTQEWARKHGLIGESSYD
jgi:hypothetical protein